MTPLYDEYAALCAQIAELETKKDQLKPHILEQMAKNDFKPVDSTLGKFSVSKLKKWVYPEYVTKLEEEFKAAKAKSVSTREATYTEEESLRFTLIKL